jgi:hypothetical protein
MGVNNNFSFLKAGEGETAVPAVPAIPAVLTISTGPAVREKSKIKSLARPRARQKDKNSNDQGKEQIPETLDKMSEVVSASLKFSRPGVVVEVIDLWTDTTTLYPSIRKACEAMSTTIGSIHRRNNLQIAKGIHTPYRKRYLITFLESK